MITLTPGWAGFIKGLGGAIVFLVVAYLADAAHLTGILNPTMAFTVAGLFSGIESSMKAKTGGTTALFGAAKVSR